MSWLTGCAGNWLHNCARSHNVLQNGTVFYAWRVTTYNISLAPVFQHIFLASQWTKHNNFFDTLSSEFALKMAESQGEEQQALARPDLEQSEESTELIPSSEFAHRAAKYEREFQAIHCRLANAGQSEESTQLVTSDSEQQEFFTAPEPFTLVSSSLLDRDPGDSPNASTQHADVPLEQLVVRWDSRIRVVFKRPRGLSFQIDQAEQQSLTIWPRTSGSSEKQPYVDFIGCIQGRSDPMFSLKVGSIQCNFFYVPNCDDVIMYNRGGFLEVQCTSKSEFSAQLPANECCTLKLGTWKVWTPQHALEFQLWPRQYSIAVEEERVLGKRRTGESMLPATKRRHMLGSDRSLFMDAMIPLSSSLEGETAHIAYRLADDQAWFAFRPRNGQTLRMRDGHADEPGYCLAYKYARWERQSRTSYVFHANLNDNMTSTKGVVVKTFTQPHKMYAQEEEKRRLVITNAARMWYAEFKQHRQLDHVSKLYFLCFSLLSLTPPP